MKKIMGMAGSFLLGVGFFAAGGAVAIEATQPADTPTVEYIVEEPVVEDVIIIEEPVAEEVVIEAPAFIELQLCATIGESTELNNNCYCVEGYVDQIFEADCLLASGVTSNLEYDLQVAYIKNGGFDN